MYDVRVSKLTRERILEVARDIFVERGEAAVTMRAVAAKTGLSAMATYRHFESRDALLRAIIERGHDKFLERMLRALAAPDPLARLDATGQAYLDFALTHPRDYDLMFMRAGEVDEQCTAEAWREAATFRFLVDRLRECADAGLLGLDDPELAALSTWALVHGLVSLYLARKLQVDEAPFRDLYARSLHRLQRLPAPAPQAAAARSRRHK